jgi:hypothetical protein
MKKILKITILFFVCGMFYSSAMGGNIVERVKNVESSLEKCRQFAAKELDNCNKNKSTSHSPCDKNYLVDIQNCETVNLSRERNNN